MRKILVFGAFDLLHPGHISLFKDAKRLGDHLTVVVARNSTIEKIKGSEPKYDEDDRLQHVQELNVVDRAILGHEDDYFNIIEEVKPDVICLGYDQHVFADDLPDKLKQMGLSTEIVRLEPYKEDKYKSSKLKQ